MSSLSPTLDAARKGFRRLEATVDQAMVGLVVGDRCKVAGEDAEWFDVQLDASLRMCGATLRGLFV